MLHSYISMKPNIKVVMFFVLKIYIQGLTRVRSNISGSVESGLGSPNVDGRGAGKGGRSTPLLLVRIHRLELELVVVDPEVRRGRVELLPQGPCLPLHVGLVAVLWRRGTSSRPPPTHH